MANEATITVSLGYNNGTIPAEQLAQQGFNADVAGGTFIKLTQTIPTTAGGTALTLGGITAPGWICIRNLDATNYIKIMTAVSGTVVLRLHPGKSQLFRFDETITAPAAIANAAPVQIEFLLLPI